MQLRHGLTVVSILAALVGSQVTHAQASLTISGGASLPMSDYADYAKTGWVGTVGVLFKVGEKGLSLGAQGLYGGNSHADYDGDKTTLLGALGTAVYRLTEAGKPGLSLIGNLGLLRHTYSSTQFPNEEGSSSGVAYGAGAVFSVPRGNLNWYASVRYLMASIDDETTAFVPVTVGVSVPLGSKK